MLTVSVYTSLQRFVVRGGFLNQMWFLSIWQFSTGSVFMNLFGLLRLLLISQENVDVSEFNCTPHQQNSGQIIKLFIGRMSHIPLNGCLERVNAIFCGIKSCFCDGEKKNRKEKRTRITLYSLKFSERFCIYCLFYESQISFFSRKKHF